MKLSVVMSVHNNASTLKQAIDSLLHQTFKNFQLIILNDASTDESTTILTKSALDDKRIKIITNKAQLGLTKSLNKALKQVKTKYIARMDADDISLPRRLEKQLDFLEKHSDIMFIGTAAYLINDQEKQIGLKRFPSDNKTLRHLILRYCPFIHPTWMFRRSILREIGDYNENFPFAQDYEFVLRLMSKYQVANLPQPLLRYRVDSPTAISLKNLKQQEKFALKARYLALSHYGYPRSESWKLVKPALSCLVPASIKKPIYRRFFWEYS